MLRRFSVFTAISGIGWVLDFVVMGSLVQVGMAVFAANAIGATCGVSFVFFAASHRLFAHRRGWSRGALLAAYALWQVVAIAAASLAIAALSAWLLGAAGLRGEGLSLPLVEIRGETLVGLGAKIAVTPATLLANFLFMKWLLEGR